MLIRPVLGASKSAQWHYPYRYTETATFHANNMTAMRKLVPLLLIATLVAVCGGNAQQRPDEIATSPRIENSLSMHAEVVEQSYCHNYDDMFTVFMDLKLQFTNSSGHPVILARRIPSPNIVRAARDAEAGKNGVFLYSPDPHFTVAKLPKSPPIQNVPDSKLFVILAPGEGHETLVHSGVLAATGEANGKPMNGLLPKGSYVLQVGVTTWPYQWPLFDPHTDPQELKKRWAKYGELSTGLVYSDLVPFTIPENFKNPLCK
jgi:hypothetical protein